MAYANYDTLASAALDNFLNDISFNFHWSRGFRTFNDTFFDQDDQPSIHNVEKIKDFIYAVNFESGRDGQFILVLLTPAHEFDMLFFVVSDRIGRGEKEIIKGARSDIEDWLMHQTFLPDVDYVDYKP